MQDNCNPIKHAVKRSLSVYEKSTLPFTPGYALLMPGSPPQNENHVGEIEELRQVAPGVIIDGVEWDWDTYQQLKIHYKDIKFFNEDISINVKNAYYSYMHLDFYSHFNHPVRTCLKEINLLVPSRIRVTLSTNRRSQHDLLVEQSYREEVLGPLAEYVGLDWEDYDNLDTTILIAAYVIRKVYFTDIYDNMSPKNFIPLYHKQIKNVERFIYLEADGKTQMRTIWFDIGKADFSAKERVENMLEILESLQHPTPIYNPDFYA